MLKKSKHYHPPFKEDEQPYVYLKKVSKWDHLIMYDTSYTGDPHGGGTEFAEAKS